MSAPNKWTLAGGGISVHYTPLSGGHFHFQHGATNLIFAGPQIRVVPEADLGTLVSVTLHLTIDSGSTTFTVLLPVVNLDGTHPVEPVHTEGVTTLHRLFPPVLGQKEFYQVTPLAGSASL